MAENGNGKSKLFQYLNSFLLSLIAIFSIFILTTVRNVRESQIKLSLEQTVMQGEDLRLKTIQDINVINVANQESRIIVLETNYIERLKNWIDLNYIRKPQK